MAIFFAKDALSSAINWTFAELWYTGNRRLSENPYRVLRNGTIDYSVNKSELVCGDILIITPNNPYVPENCIILSENDKPTEIYYADNIQINEAF